MPVIKGAPEPTDADVSLAAEVLAETAKHPQPSSSGKPSHDPDRIGVVFIHGIGSQEPGQTLLDWSGPIVRAVRGWHLQRNVTIDPVRRSQLDFSGATVPIVKVAIPAVGGDAGHPAQEWTLTEAWWAKDVDPPSAAMMIGWLFRAGEIQRLINGIFSGLASNGETGVWVRAERILLRPFAVLATFLGPVLYGLISLLRFIPLKPLQDEVVRRQLDFFMVDWFGDVRLLVADRVQAANVRAKVAKTVKALSADGCGRIVVIGHSGGAIVSYMSLADPLYIPAQDGAEEGPLAFRADRLITHGQGLELAWLLGHALDGGSVIADDRLSPGDRLMEVLSDNRPELEWVDFWATHDPAPAGPIGGVEARAATETMPEVKEQPSEAVDRPGVSVGVHNRMSLINDHGSYWDNDEQFVLPVIRLIETTGTPTESRFYPTGPVDVRGVARRRRVRSLAEWWAWLVGSGLILLAGALALEAWFGGRGLQRVGASAIELLRLITNLDAADRQYDGPLINIIGPIAGLIPGPDLDVASWISVLPSWVIGLLLLVVFLWVAGKPAGRAWNRWDGAARSSSLTDAAAEVRSRAFRAIGPLSVAMVWIVAAAAVIGVAANDPLS